MAWRSVQQVILLLLLADYVAAEESANSSCTVGITERTSFPHDRLEYIQWENSNSAETGISPGHQIIIPGMRFNCHGFIANWSALTVLYREFTMHSHHIYFQVWRPIGNERYQRVHDDYLKFLSFELQNNNIVLPNDEDVVSFEFVEQEPQGEDRSYFQPGDVLGVFIPPPPNPAFPIGITYRNATPDDDISTVVDIYSVPAAEQLCEMSLCAENIIKFSGVIPHLSLSYETIDPAVPTPAPVTDSCSSTSFATCIPSPSTFSSSVPTPSSLLMGNSDDGSSIIGSTVLFIAVGTAGVLLGALSMLMLVVVIAVGVKRKQSTTHCSTFEMTGNEANIVTEGMREDTTCNEAYGTVAIEDHNTIPLSENEAYATAGDLELSGDVITSQNQAYGSAAAVQPPVIYDYVQ